MKKGTGSRVKVVIEVKTPVTTAIRPGIPPEEIRRNHIDNEKGKRNGQVVRSKNTIPPKSKLMTNHHSIGYFPLLIPTNLLHAILKNWMVRRMLPMGMIMKIVHFGTVTALTSVIPFRMHSRT